MKVHMKCTKDQFGKTVIFLDTVLGIDPKNVQEFAVNNDAIWYDEETDQAFIRVHLPGEIIKLYEIKAFALVLRTAQNKLAQKELVQS